MKQTDIIEHFSNFELPNFEFRFVEEKYITFKRKSINRNQSIGVMNVNKMKSRGISCYLQFLNYERLCQEEVNMEDTVLPSSVRPYTHNVVMVSKLDTDSIGAFPIEVSTTKDLNLISKFLQEYVDKIAQPFFNYWLDIRVFLPFIEIDSQKSVEFLGNNYTLRKMVIWKLCSHPRYEEFVNKRKDVLQRGILREKENDSYIYHLNEVEQKYKLLSGVEPEFEWDDSYLIEKPFGSISMG